VIETKDRNLTEEQTPFSAINEGRRRFSLSGVVRFFGLLLVVGGFFAVYRVCQIIWEVGGNNISNDYLDVVPFIDRALRGDVQFDSIVSVVDSLRVGQHLVALPMLFHFLSASLFDWNARAELLFGVAINLVKAFLLWDIVARDQRKHWRPLLLGMILAFIFSMTQASVHFFGQACFPVSLTTLGFTMALWGLLRFRRDWRGPALMVAGGIGSAASMGNVVPCWCALLAALFLYGYRLNKWPVYAAWLLGAIVSVAPYAYFLLGRSSSAGQTSHGLDLIFIINLLGRPFANQVGLQVGRLPMAEYVGVVGLVVFSVALIANYRLRQFDLPVRSSLILCLYGLVSAVVLSAVRVFVTPWYGAFAIYFWIGLAGLLVCAIAGALDKKDKSRADIVYTAVCLACIASAPVLYCVSNRSWEDKHVYLFTRSFASESALRNFREAPSYIESLLFQWGDGRPENVLKLALPLERHSLSAFSPDQVWSLQGDFVLPRVRVFNALNVAPVSFIENITVDHPVPWSHYERANLYLHASNAVSWDIYIPADAHSARLKSAFTIGAPAKRRHTDIVDGATARVYAVTNDQTSEQGNSVNKKLLAAIVATKEGQWQPIQVDLSDYKGKRLTLILTSDGGKNSSDDLSIFQFPRIDVKLNRESKSTSLAAAENRSTTWLPTNTDLSTTFGKNLERVSDFPSLSEPAWKCEPLSIETPGDIRGTTKDSLHQYSALFYSPSRSIPVQDFTHLIFKMRAPKSMEWRSLKVSLLLENGKLSTFSVPLPVDEAVHSCSYDLKLCAFPQGARIKQMVLYPVAKPGTHSFDSITVESVSLAKEKPPAWRINR